MTDRIGRYALQVATVLAEFIANEAFAVTGGCGRDIDGRKRQPGSPSILARVSTGQ